MKVCEFDKKFDGNENIVEDLDLLHARRPGQEQKHVNVDFPVWMITALDRESAAIGRDAPVG